MTIKESEKETESFEGYNLLEILQMLNIASEVWWREGPNEDVSQLDADTLAHLRDHLFRAVRNKMPEKVTYSLWDEAADIREAERVRCEKEKKYDKARNHCNHLV